MRILLLSSAFPPHVYGGGEVAAFNMAKLLARRGHEISVATLQEKDAAPAWGTEMPEGYRLYRLKSPRPYTYYSRTDAVPAWKKPLWHLQDYVDVRNRALVRALLQDVKPDQIDIHNIVGIGFNALLDIASRRIPVVYFLHDLNLACFRGSMFLNDKNCIRQCGICSASSALRQHFLNRLPRLGFISPSKGNLDRIRFFLERIAQSPCAVIRNVPDDLPPLPERQPSATVRLLYVGRLEEMKGIRFLLQVLEGLADRYAFHLDVLGSGSLENELKIAYGAKHWIRIHGFVHRSEVAKKMAEADLFCMTSLWAESYGLVTAQSLQIGTPIMGSNIGGTTELVRDGETGILLEPGNAEAWQKAFVEIFTNRALLDRWRSNALLYGGEFDADRIGQLYDDFTRQLHGQNG